MDETLEPASGGSTCWSTTPAWRPRQRVDLLEMSEASYDEVHGHQPEGAVLPDPARGQDHDRRWWRRRDGSRVIINIGSISAYTSSTNRAEYCMSKAGMAMLTALFADRLAESRHQRLRSTARHHRHRHDQRGQGQVRQAIADGLTPDPALGPARGCGQGRAWPSPKAPARSPPAKSSTWTAAFTCARL